MFGRKKPDDHARLADSAEAPAAGGPTRVAPSFGSAGSLALRKPAPAKPVGTRMPDIPGATARRPGGPHGLPHAPENKLLLVALDIAIEGKVGTCERLAVEGRLDAAVGDCRELDVAHNGIFKGSIRVEEADIAGVFDGEMTVRRRLRIRATGRVRGRIAYGHIEIEPGGQIDGEVNRLQPVMPAPAQDAQQDAAPDAGGAAPTDAAPRG